MTLSAKDTDVIARSISATADRNLYSDQEFQTLFGLSRAEMRAAVAAWRSATANEASRSAAIGAINNLLGYPRSGEERRLAFEEVGAGERELRALLEKLIAQAEARA